MGRLLLLIVTLTLAQAALAGGIYKWKDDQGVVHYGGRPPASGPSRSVTVKKSPPSDPATAGLRARERKMLRAYKEEAQSKHRAEAKAKQAAAVRKRKCNIARDDLRMLQEVGPVYHLNEQGKRVYYSDAQKQAKMDAARRAIAHWCGNGQ